MKSYFADAWFFIALFDRNDHGHHCVSMESMKTRGIAHVLTNDHHFRQEGFTVLSDAP